MKYKKTLLSILLTIIVGTLLVFNVVAAIDYNPQDGIKFTPNIAIPGSPFKLNTPVTITGDSIGEYIKALYEYGAIFAGAIAMFMLVMAGWQWLMAGGSADKISKAKDTINGVLIGLALLFGGHLILSQISTSLVSFDALKLSKIDVQHMDQEWCLQENRDPGVPFASHNKVDCGQTWVSENDTTGATIRCIDTLCDDMSSTAKCVDSIRGSDCPSAITLHENEPNCVCVETDCGKLTLDTCRDYKSSIECEKNSCYNKVSADGSIFTEVCAWTKSKKTGVIETVGYCQPLSNIRCDTTADCQKGDAGEEWCCADIWLGVDVCKEVADNIKCKP